MGSRVVHITSVHPRFDTRIYYKECRSLASYNYEVYLIVADGKGDVFHSRTESVGIIDVGKPNSRLKRVIFSSLRIILSAVKLKPELVHIHDPELMWSAFVFRLFGIKVIYDAHEDFIGQIRDKHYLNNVTKAFLMIFIKYVYFRLLSVCNGVVTAEPFVRGLLRNYKMEDSIVTVHNFPFSNEFSKYSKVNLNIQHVCYVGAITRERGIFEMIRGVYKSGFKLLLCGQISPIELEYELKEMKEWSCVNYRGICAREDVKEVLHDSFVGLVMLHPIQNYINAFPVKLFEYASAGLPIISSDIPILKNFIEVDGKIGFSIPLDPDILSDKIKVLSSNSELRNYFSKNCEKFIEDKTWEFESSRLKEFYEKVLKLNLS